MKQFLASTKKLLLILVMFHLVISYVQGAEIIWQKEFEADSGFSYSPGAVTFDAIDKKLLIMGTSFLPKEYSKGKFRLWEVDLDGNLTKDVVLGDAPGNLKAKIHSASQVIKGISVSKDRKIISIGNYNGRGKTVMSMNRKGHDRAVKSITETSLIDDKDVILKKIGLPNDASLLIGSDGRDNGLAIKIASQGTKMWEQTYDLGQLEYFSDGVAVGGNGDFIIVGCSVTPEEVMSATKPLSIWVLKCDSEGIIQLDIVFDGHSFIRKLPQICRLSSGEFIVAYNKFQPDFLSFKAFSSDLNELWENQAYEDEINAYDFKIKAVKEKGFIVAFGIGSTGLGMCEYEKNGNLISKLSWEKVVRGGNFLLEVATDRAFLILQTRSKTEDRINNLKVMTFQLDQ